jgi:hypothetical protein
MTRSWIYGGLRSDGSGIGFDELWEMRYYDSDNRVEWIKSNTPTNLESGGGGGMYDGVAVLVPNSSSSSGEPSIYLLGGIESSLNSLASFSTIHYFVPSNTNMDSVVWLNVSTISESPSPSPRRGHSAVYLGNSKIWISGGRNLNGDLVYSDSWILDLNEKIWTRVSDASEPSWSSSTIVLGETVLTSFGQFSTISYLSEVSGWLLTSRNIFECDRLWT